MTCLDAVLRFADAGIGDLPVPIRRLAHEQDLDFQSAQVASFSRHEGLMSAAPTEWLPRALKILFGITTPGKMADPRLEALRRFCIYYRHNDPRSVDAAFEVVALHGYSERELRAACAIVEADGHKLGDPQ